MAQYINKKPKPEAYVAAYISNTASLHVDYSCVKHHVNFACPNSLKLKL